MQIVLNNSSHNYIYTTNYKKGKNLPDWALAIGVVYRSHSLETFNSMDLS